MFEEQKQALSGDEGGDWEERDYKQSIVLEITAAEEGETKDWDIYPMNSLAVGTNCMHCALIITWNFSVFNEQYEIHP